MSVLSSLRIRNLRCIRRADLSLPQGLVWLRGANGAGKTTLLEAIYLLDRGRTFRGRRSGPVTTRGEAATTVVGVVDDGGRPRKLQWTSQDGGAVAGPALTRFVGTSSYSVVEGDPALRRRFLDWSLFHVERRAPELWRRVKRLQQQRNAWLRGGARGKAVWDAPYVEELAELWGLRTHFLHVVNDAYQDLTTTLCPAGALGLRWHWSGQGRDLGEVLASHLAGDMERGYTFLSPSRGDLVFERESLPWSGSRGENKIAGMLLQLAVQDVVRRSGSAPQVVLLDDPYAEVSEMHIGPVVRRWLESADQLIVTSLADRQEPGAGLDVAAMFHVEQGDVKSMADQ
ncbi:AAA family ATPase [uncultured Thiohalocapsa sp.]|uniref:DNA replication/repair protein RecF n=1 Tax=uncultured Thiohalocapsa sp. TaxID=768990 RepID=UPI0025E8E45E|nr:AAA family ATPase [uncultured Thiohalocapsa sp.]